MEHRNSEQFELSHEETVEAVVEWLAKRGYARNQDILCLDIGEDVTGVRASVYTTVAVTPRPQDGPA